MSIIKAKKSLGQNFLQDHSVKENIVKMSGADKNTDVLEIGPGLGAITELLVENARTVTAVEIDERLYKELSIKFQNKENFKIINEDILAINIHSLLTDNTIVVANLPYYITTPIITTIIEGAYNRKRIQMNQDDAIVDSSEFMNDKIEPLKRIKSMTVMVQLEVAKRICGNETTKDYGAISVLCNYYCNTELLFVVPPEAFIPIPKVHSAVIKLTFLEEPKVSPNDEKLFFRTVKAAFSNRRKTLANCLMNSFCLKREEVNEILTNAGIELMARGETLSLEKFKNISDLLLNYINNEKI